MLPQSIYDIYNLKDTIKNFKERWDVAFHKNENALIFHKYFKIYMELNCNSYCSDCSQNLNNYQAQFTIIFS